MYDFDTLIDRTGTGSCKWERRTEEEKRLGIVAMSVADMELAAPPCVREAVVRAAQHGIYGYTDATDAYYEAVAGWMMKRHGLEVTRDDILHVSGVVPAVAIAIRAFTEPGDGVIIQTPVYHPFAASIELNRRRVEKCPLTLAEGGYEMDYESLERAAKKPDTKLMLLCSPHNPVGRVWTRAELQRVFDIARSNGVLVVSDEIHADLVEGGRHVAFPALSEEARHGSVTLNAPSKTFNVPGLQNANALIFNKALRETFGLRSRIDGFDNISYFGHAATIAAYNAGEDWLDAVLRYVRGNYEVLDAFLKENMPFVKLYPMEGTYLAWTDFRKMGLDAAALEQFMREDARLILDEGYIFGEEGAGFERWNLALPRHVLLEALARLKAAFAARF